MVPLGDAQVASRTSQQRSKPWHLSHWCSVFWKRGSVEFPLPEKKIRINTIEVPLGRHCFQELAHKKISVRAIHARLKNGNCSSLRRRFSPWKALKFFLNNCLNWIRCPLKCCNTPNPRQSHRHVTWYCCMTLRLMMFKKNEKNWRPF